MPQELLNVRFTEMTTAAQEFFGTMQANVNKNKYSNVGIYSKPSIAAFQHTWTLIRVEYKSKPENTEMILNETYTSNTQVSVRSISAVDGHQYMIFRLQDLKESDRNKHDEFFNKMYNLMILIIYIFHCGHQYIKYGRQCFVAFESIVDKFGYEDYNNLTVFGKDIDKFVKYKIKLPIPFIAFRIDFAQNDRSVAWLMRLIADDIFNLAVRKYFDNAFVSHIYVIDANAYDTKIEHTINGRYRSKYKLEILDKLSTTYKFVINQDMANNLKYITDKSAETVAKFIKLQNNVTNGVIKSKSVITSFLKTRSTRLSKKANKLLLSLDLTEDTTKVTETDTEIIVHMPRADKPYKLYEMTRAANCVGNTDKNIIYDFSKAAISDSDEVVIPSKKDIEYRMRYISDTIDEMHIKISPDIIGTSSEQIVLDYSRHIIHHIIITIPKMDFRRNKWNDSTQPEIRVLTAEPPLTYKIIDNRIKL